jgi:hypothetical protein
MTSERAPNPSDDDAPTVDPDPPEPSEEVAPPPPGTDPPELLEDVPLAPSKTPFFQAVHALRYQRQAMIKLIEGRLNHPIICYVSGDLCSLDRDDTIGFTDLLHNIPAGSDLDLLLHTGGGDIDAAEKLISLVRKRVAEGRLRIIIPDFAKSAGTLMALGADSLVMSDTSELGPIDPQIVLADADGNRIRYSVQNYLDAYKTHSDTLTTTPTNVPAQIMLNKLDPARVKLFESVRDRARNIAENQLKRGMFRDGTGNYTKTAAALLDTTRWLTHGQMISWEDAADDEIGLTVEYLEPTAEEWQEYWQLYCLQRLAVGDRQKLFESNYASLVVDSPA